MTRLATVAAALFALSLLAAPQYADARAESHGPICRQVSVQDREPRWVHYGAWDPAGETLSLVDIAHATILRFRADGSAYEQVARPGRGPLDFNHPAEIRAHEGGYLLLDLKGRSPHFIWLDRDLRSVRALTPAATGGQDTSSLSGKCWAYLGGELVGYGRRTDSSGRRQRGWLALDATTNQLVSFRPENMDWEYIGLNRCSVVSVSGQLFLLDLGNPSHIRKIFPGAPSRLSAFPDRFREPPTLPPRGGPAASVSRYRALSKAPAAVELHASGDYLFLLTREPSKEETIWRVHKIDPAADRIVGAHRLPTTAAHVRLVPGPVHWAVLENGPVIAPGQKELLGWWLVPSSLLESDPRPARSVSVDDAALCL